MAAKCDVEKTIEYIHEFWPEFEIDKNDLAKGNIDFVIRFYNQFINEINEYLSSFDFLQENLGDEAVEDIRLHKTLALYCKVSKILKNLSCVSLALADFFIPNPKKMITLMTVSMHILAYINNFYDQINGLVDHFLKKLSDRDNMKQMKQQLLETCAENAKELAILMDKHEDLKKQEVEIREKHEQWLKEKATTDEFVLRGQSEMKALENELEELDEEVRSLEELEADLKERIVTYDVEDLKRKRNLLETEVKEIISEESGTYDVTENIVHSANLIKKIAEDIARINYDSLDVQTLHRLTEEEASKKKVLKEQGEEINVLESAVASENVKVDNLCDDLKQTRLHALEVEEQFSAEAKSEKRQLMEKAKMSAAQFEEWQKLESEMLAQNEEIREIDEEMEMIKDKVKEQFERVMAKDKEVVTKLYNQLSYCADKIERKRML